MSLTAAERETVITMNDEDKVAAIWTAQRPVITKLKKNPSAVLIEEGNFDGSVWARFELPAGLISFRSVKVRRELTEEQRAEASARMKALRAQQGRPLAHPPLQASMTNELRLDPGREGWDGFLCCILKPGGAREHVRTRRATPRRERRVALAPALEAPVRVRLGKAVAVPRHHPRGARVALLLRLPAREVGCGEAVLIRRVRNERQLPELRQGLDGLLLDTQQPGTILLAHREAGARLEPPPA